jgi:hypothetical protein
MTLKHMGLFALIAFVLNAVMIGYCPAADSALEKKSISQWVSCKETQDDSEGAIRAFAAARRNAFTLVVDCPVFIHSGLDIGRVIFIDDGTSVEFTPAGKFVVDNIMHPAFALANATSITLTNWNVEYNATFPVNPDVGGYAQNGHFFSVAGHNQPSAWNDLELTPWLAKNRAIDFKGVRASWSGTTNICAVFFVTGDTSKVTITGLNVHVPPNVGPDHFVPVVFEFSTNIKSNASVTPSSSRSAQYVGVPHDITFSNITFDGTLMGWVGNVQDVTFDHIRSHRYADLQGTDGGNPGGLGKWFAPPHLFYLGYPSNEDPLLYNRNIKIHDVVDDGPRVGTARDKGGSDTSSGNALSLKIGCYQCSVDGYTSNRPDGFLDVLPSHGLTISNVNATYDSSFLNNIFPGWRFPSTEYSDLTFENITLRDTAATTMQLPVGNSTVAANQNIKFRNVHIILNRWGGPSALPVPTLSGSGIDVALDYEIAADASRIASARKGSLSVALKATPASAGSRATTVTWSSTQADACSAGGAWSGSLPPNGSRSVTIEKQGKAELTLSCRNSSDSAEATLRVD